MLVLSVFLFQCSVITSLNEEDTYLCAEKFSFICLFMQFIDVFNLVFLMLFILVMLFLLYYVCLGLGRVLAFLKLAFIIFLKIPFKMVVWLDLIMKKLVDLGISVIMKICMTLWVFIKWFFSCIVRKMLHYGIICWVLWLMNRVLWIISGVLSICRALWVLIKWVFSNTRKLLGFGITVHRKIYGFFWIKTKYTQRILKKMSMHLPQYSQARIICNEIVYIIFCLLYLLIRMLGVFCMLIFIDYLFQIISHGSTNFTDFTNFTHSHWVTLARNTENYSLHPNSLIYFSAKCSTHMIPTKMKLIFSFLILLLKIIRRILLSSQSSCSRSIKSNHFYIRKRLKVSNHRKSVDVPCLFQILTYHLMFKHTECIQNGMSKCYNKPESFQIFKTMVSLHSLWLYSLSSQRKKWTHDTSRYHWIFLMRSGDVEKNPGPGTSHEILYQLNHPCLCGFYRASMINVLRRNKLLTEENINSNSDTKVEIEDGIRSMKNIFNGHFFLSELDFTKISKRSSRVVETMNKWKRNSDRGNYEVYFNTFSAANWLKLDKDTKTKHTAYCRECETSYLLVHETFPCKSNQFLKEKKRLDSLVLSQNKENVSEVLEKVKPELKRLFSQSLSELQTQEVRPKKIGKKLLNSFSMNMGDVLDECYREHDDSNDTFCESFANGKKLVPKITYNEKRKQLSKVKRECVKQMKSFNDSTCDLSLYAGDSSERSWDRERARKYMMSKPEAKKLVEQEADKINKGIKQPKDHIGSFDGYRIDKSGIYNIVSTWNDKTEVNWTKDLGKPFIRKLNEDKAPDNCGQIAKSFVLEEEKAERLSVNYLNKNIETEKRIRRPYNKLSHNLSVAIENRSASIKKVRNAKIESGEINIGIEIMKRTYEKVSINKKGETVRKRFTVSGRKHPFLVIREKVFHQYHQYMRLNNDAYFNNLDESELCNRLSLIGEFYKNEDKETMRDKLKGFERTRNFQLWHDGSSIANSGHIVFCVNVLYDQAVFFTTKEYEEKFGCLNVDIQREVETPELYIIARCRSTDEQLGFLETRLACIKELKINLNVKKMNNSYDNFELTDYLRLFHGDGCAMWFETGNNSNGHYFCPSCDIHRCQADDISTCYNRPIRSLTSRQKEVLKGPIGRENSIKKKNLPFNERFLTAKDMKKELSARGVDVSKLGKNKNDLGHALKKSLKGIKRVPVILLHNPLKELKEIGLPTYEFAMVEPMHDVAKHIQNVLEEFAHHLKEPHKTTYKNIYEPMKNSKEMKRCCDWRQFLLNVTHDLSKILLFPRKTLLILITLSEIQRILYLKDEYRTAQEILRLHKSVIPAC